MIDDVSDLLCSPPLLVEQRTLSSAPLPSCPNSSSSSLATLVSPCANAVSGNQTIFVSPNTPSHAAQPHRGRRALSLSDVNDLCSTLFRVALSSGMGQKHASTDEATVTQPSPERLEGVRPSGRWVVCGFDHLDALSVWLTWETFLAEAEGFQQIRFGMLIKTR